MACPSAGPRMARSTRGHLGDRVTITGREARHTDVAVSATEQVRLPAPYVLTCVSKGIKLTCFH